MSLPVDPTSIDPDDFGEKRVVLSMSHDEAVETVREACTKHGFGIPVEFSPSELLNEKVDANRDPYYVLGACNPAIADDALEITDQIGGLFPCNMVIWEEAPTRQVVYHVSIMRIARLLGMASDDDRWADIVARTGENVDAVFDELATNVSD